MKNDHNKYLMAIGAIASIVTDDRLKDAEKLSWIERSLLMYEIIEEEDLAKLPEPLFTKQKEK